MAGYTPYKPSTGSPTFASVPDWFYQFTPASGMMEREQKQDFNELSLEKLQREMDKQGQITEQVNQAQTSGLSVDDIADKVALIEAQFGNPEPLIRRENAKRIDSDRETTDMMRQIQLAEMLGPDAGADYLKRTGVEGKLGAIPNLAGKKKHFSYGGQIVEETDEGYKPVYSFPKEGKDAKTELWVNEDTGDSIEIDPSSPGAKKQAYDQGYTKAQSGGKEDFLESYMKEKLTGGKVKFEKDIKAKNEEGRQARYSSSDLKKQGYSDKHIELLRKKGYQVD